NRENRDGSGCRPKSIPATNDGFLRCLAACGGGNRRLGTHWVLRGSSFRGSLGPYPVALTSRGVGRIRGGQRRRGPPLPAVCVTPLGPALVAANRRKRLGP